MKEFPTHYRYDDYAHEDGVEVRVREFYPIRETPCFYIIVDEFEKHMMNMQTGREPRTKRVSKDGLRRSCYPSKEQALKSFKARKRSQIGHNEFALAKARQALFAVEAEKDEFDKLECGRPDYWDSLNFD